ncbi:MAG: hypothetical protein FRX48_02681 [Lasallia pustulata]|uniref:Uncharacterized protein n=1 Tax=Lasallia pustulata TaxID=136370 RepID=A0A5M8Q072_9LECA|nr:MAG: hypothetical protein FRX48_02681 [Lasallia pustulata]
MTDDSKRVDDLTTRADPTTADDPTAPLDNGIHPDEPPHTRLHSQEGNHYHGPTNVTGGSLIQGNVMSICQSNESFPQRPGTLLRTPHIDSYQPDEDNPQYRHVVKWLSPLSFQEKQIDVYGACQPEYWA